MEARLAGCPVQAPRASSRSPLGPRRAAISDAQQQLDLNAFAGPLETPVLGGAAAKRSGVSFADVPETPAGGPASTSQLVSDILLHRNPPLTCLAAGAGALLLAAAWVLLHGAHGLTLLTGACCCLVCAVGCGAQVAAMPMSRYNQREAAGHEMKAAWQAESMHRRSPPAFLSLPGGSCCRLPLLLDRTNILNALTCW